MNTIKRIVKNTSLLLLAQLLSLGTGFIFLVYSARYLGVSGYGTISFALAYIGIFSIFTDFGLNNLLIRELARDKLLTIKYVKNFFSIKIIFALITMIIIISSINLLNYPKNVVYVVYVIAFYLLFNTFSQMFYSIFQAHEKMEYQTIGQIINGILLLMGVFFAINYKFSVLGFSFIYFFTSLITFIYILIIFILYFARFKLEFDWQFLKKNIKTALPFGLSTIFVSTYFYIDTVILSLIKGTTPVGWYTAAYNLVYVLLFFATAYFSSIYPIMAKFYETSKNSLKIGYEHSFRYMLMIAFPLAVGVTLFANNIILLIYGNEFQPSILALQILVWAMFFSYLSYTPMYSLYSINKQAAYTKVVFCCMVLNVILNLILIPKFSYISASVVTVITEFLAFILLFQFVKSHLGNPFSYKFLIKLTFCVATLGLFIIYFKNILGLILTIFGGIILYILLAMLLKVISQEDLLIIRGLLKK